ncbi:MAG: SigB/SigF/SigG family RNA polymerase sigma factor [Clostridia bacterium]|nr:SigB/SigF/SigG family RNA polymerase sigma factor [Clostridia bacterium]
MLEYGELLKYVRLAQNGDINAKETVFKSNTPLIKSIIRRFVGKGVEYDDLYQIASVGFLKAIKNFDESLGVKFSTYTVPMVIGEIKRYMRDNGAIKVSRTLKILANKINKYIDAYSAAHDESPSVESIAENFGISQDEVVVALDSNRMPISIFDSVGDEDDGQELIERIPYVDSEDKILNGIHLTDIISHLSEREKKIVYLRFFRDKTQSEVAESIGVSQVQISRLENKIIDKIRSEYET